MTDKVTRRPAQGPRVAVAQIAPALGDIQTNITKHREAVERALAESADIVIFPELSLTGYRLKDSVPEVAIGRHDELMNELAALSERISILVGLVAETREHHFFNCGVYFEDGQIRHTHRKVYLPTYGMFDEQRYFARGRRIIAFDTKHGRMAVLICEDMLHPTAATIAALDGATTILVPSASPVRGVVSDDDGGSNARHWHAYNQAMARALGVFVVYANRIGVEDGHTFWGGSEIIGPDGETLAQAAYYEDELVSAVLAPEALRRKRIQAPVVRDEDVDLTINELARIRGRAGDRCDVVGDQQLPRRSEGERSRTSYSDSAGEDRRPRGGGGGGYQDDRRSRGGGGGYQDDRRSRGGGGGGYQDDRRSRGGGGGGYQDDRRSRGGGGGYQDDRRPRGGGGGGGGGGYQDDRRSRGGGGGGYQDERRFGGSRQREDSPQRERPNRGERRPRPVGGGGGPSRGGGRDRGRESPGRRKS